MKLKTKARKQSSPMRREARLAPNLAMMQVLMIVLTNNANSEDKIKAKARVEVRLYLQAKKHHSNKSQYSRGCQT
jgi:hypothetical protein